GPEKTARLLGSTAPRLAQIGLVIEQQEINHQYGAIARDRAGRVLQTVVLDIRDCLIHAIRSVANPDKLGHLGPVADPWALNEDYHAATRAARSRQRDR